MQWTDELYSSLLARQVQVVNARSSEKPTKLLLSTRQKNRRDQAYAESGATRFHLVPPTGWDESVHHMQCGARNILKKKNEEWVPEVAHQCWLLPASDEVAVQLAQQQVRLRTIGWKILTCEANVVLRLGNKAMLRDHAEQHGLLEYLPVHYTSPDVAVYPCILKGAAGEFGKENHIVKCKDDVLRVTKSGSGIGSQWVLQELISGCREYSVSLLVNCGRILVSLGTAYDCNRSAFIWPHVRGVKQMVHEASEVELAVMGKFMTEYSGICNFNYKIRECGKMSIFEINTRVGGDLACDVPKDQARHLFETLDTLSTWSIDNQCQHSLSHLNGTAWEEPLVIEPRNGVHEYTLVYLHPFRIGLRDYVRKMGLFSIDGLRIVMPSAPRREITCFQRRTMKAWYDYTVDNNGHAEDELDEATLADTVHYLSKLLDQERARFWDVAHSSACGDRVLIGGCSQGCGTALDVALRYPVQLKAFVGIVGHPLAATPLGKHLDMPLHFFVGANDKVMRWHWVGESIKRLKLSGYRHIVVHGPLRAVHHGVTREFEANCVHDVFRTCAD